MNIEALKITLDLLPGIWCLMDSESRYLHYNKAYAELVGVADKDASYLLGKTVADMHCEAAECAPLFWEEDALVKSSKKRIRVLNIIRMAEGSWKVLQIDKQPVLNKDGEVEAIIFQLIDQSANHILDFAMSIAQKPPEESDNQGILISSNLSQSSMDLKPKESECLFYLIRGLSYKEIAKVQKISYRTVVDHVERLKLKFSALTTTQLLSLALANGYPGSIPQHYFKKQMSIVLMQE